MEQSWCVETTTGEVQDICPRCYVTGGNGAAGSRFAGAEYQEQGEPAVEPAGGGTGGVAEPAEKPAAEPTEEGTKRAAVVETADKSTDTLGGGETDSRKKAKTAL